MNFHSWIHINSSRFIKCWYDCCLLIFVFLLISNFISIFRHRLRCFARMWKDKIYKVFLNRMRISEGVNLEEKVIQTFYTNKIISNLTSGLDTKHSFECCEEKMIRLWLFLNWNCFLNASFNLKWKNPLYFFTKDT